MSEATTRGRDRDLPIDALHELAAIERKLRLSNVENVEVRVAAAGARVSFDTSRHAEHHRGSITASLTQAIAHTDAWSLTTVHDPMKIDESTTNSMFTLVTERTQ